MKNKPQKRDRKNCKYYSTIDKKTAYCNYLGCGLQCYKVCNLYVDITNEFNPKP